ncbi:hypothetical protein ILUMI_04364 [Ignelater luminosus]|uniref:Uncharacterized protein n=1 Tax=Ignelater luminosus TaxID=2038154 RepID=A0A8K0D941_IGNLU|nr:hypothetical protein ILUMI_04364 [Ignelater luminosus]
MQLNHIVKVGSNKFINFRNMEYLIRDRIIGGLPAKIKNYPLMTCLVTKSSFKDVFRRDAVIIRLTGLYRQLTVSFAWKQDRSDSELNSSRPSIFGILGF